MKCNGARVSICVLLLLSWRPANGDARQSRTPDSSPTSVVQVSSPALGAAQSVAVLLPAGYTDSRSRYPVFYLLHGGGQDHTAFATRDWFPAQTARAFIIVTPDVGESWYVNSVSDPSAKYEDFIVKDLVAYIDANFRTVATREGRAIGGVSMGAWGAMLLGLKHHRLFGAVGALSAPFGISRQDPNMDMTSRTQQRFGAPGTPERLERDPASLAMTTPAESMPSLFLACGSQDIFVRDNRAFVQRLADRKVPYEYREVSPFGHSWDLWDGQLVNFMDILSARWSSVR